jgi:light-regulated signal transduction histidine kinase (bacteriophytochrome)
MGSKINKVNKSSLDDLDNCADESVHLIGTLQGFGCLIGFNRETQDISFYSDETSKILDVNSDILQDGKWTDLTVLSSNLFNLDNWSKINQNESFLDIHETIGSHKYVINFQTTEQFILAEIEVLDNTDVESRFYEQTNQFVDQSNRVSSLKSLADVFASLLKDLTNYDRVMVYKFDKDYNGEVFAESKNTDLEAFYGLHYPHTDIPSQARELYKRKQLRLLANVNAEDQNIITNIVGLKANDIDLSMMTLRSVSPVHVQYLKNMGVTATLTISIMLDKQLWGLIACHHHSPKILSYNKRKEALLQTQLFSSQLQRWEAYEEYQKVQEKEHIYQSILEEVMRGGDKFEAATSSSYFIGLTESDGGAVIRNGSIYSFGDTPDDSKILEIQQWMQEKNERVFLSDEFSKYTDLGIDIKDVASGVLYYSFDSSSESAMIWFRKQLSEGILWGGRQEDSVDHLTPRNSFDAWEDEVNGKSAEWHSHQIQAGFRLGSFLEKEVFITSLKEQKQQLERAADQLQSKNEELSQFNWISSHDMKEPLRKIRMFIDQIRFEEDRLSDDQKNYFERLDRSAMRMQKLIADLLDYSKLSKEEAFKIENITTIIEELNDHFQTEEVPFKIDFDALPEAEIVRFQVKQLFANLISNSIKFRKKDESLIIKLRKEDLGVSEVQKYHLNPKLDYFKIIYSDNGIGFEKEYNDQIFEVFQRLHSQKNFEGTGIGLAICKKVAASHRGEIFAEGEPGIGVTFTLILPRYQQEH